jgi:hypothetical protein
VGRSFDLAPVFYYWGGGVGGSGFSVEGGGKLKPLPLELKRRMIYAVQESVAPLSPPPAANCFSSVNYDYCVVDPA